MIKIIDMEMENVMIVLFNLASLLLGLIAWILPIINIINSKKHINKQWIRLCMISMGACAISLYFQILYNAHLVNIEDWTAMMDTIGTLVITSSILLVITLLLNVITLFLYRNK